MKVLVMLNCIHSNTLPQTYSIWQSKTRELLIELEVRGICIEYIRGIIATVDIYCPEPECQLETAVSCITDLKVGSRSGSIN